MTKFLTTDQISSEITNIIKNAGSQITLITPYLKLSDILLERLKDAGRQGKKINLVYGKDELKPDEKGKLQQLANLSLYFSKDLHAKCYYNEECMVIASMNLHEYSQGHNWEMGLLIDKEEDNKLFSEALKEIETIINLANKTRLGSSAIEKVGKGIMKVGKLVSDSLMDEESKGYCIRCRKRIPLDVDQPLCHDCWEKWNIHKKSSYREKYCHSCGKTVPTTKAMPQCNSCYRS